MGVCDESPAIRTDIPELTISAYLDLIFVDRPEVFKVLVKQRLLQCCGVNIAKDGLGCRAVSYPTIYIDRNFAVETGIELLRF